MIAKTDQSVWMTWYCRGCKQNPEIEHKPGDEVVKCPNCGTEKKIHSAAEIPQ